MRLLNSSVFITLALGLLLTACSQFSAGTNPTADAGPAPSDTPFETITCEVPENCLVRLTWSHDPPGEVGFQIERALGSPAGKFELLASISAEFLQYQDNDVAIGSSYCYRVRAFNGEGVSDWSGVACGTVTGTGLVSLKVF